MEFSSKLVASVVVQNLALPAPGVVAKQEKIDLEGTVDGFLETFIVVPAGATRTFNFYNAGLLPSVLAIFTSDVLKLDFGSPTDITTIRNMYVATYVLASAPPYVTLDNTAGATDISVKLVSSGKRTY